MNHANGSIHIDSYRHPMIRRHHFRVAIIAYIVIALIHHPECIQRSMEPHVRGKYSNIKLGPGKK